MRPESPKFPGITTPSSDFQAVRDGRRAMPFELVLDLSVARSIAAGSAAVIGVAGNSFYSDPLLDAVGVPAGGLLVARFEDVTLNPGGTRFTVAPQFIARIPFTRILIENLAQAGKFARIIYGTDIDFTPGINAQVTISGTVNTSDQGAVYATSFQSNTALGIAATETVWAPASNVAGGLIVNMHSFHGSATQSVLALLAKTGAAPANAIDGDALYSNCNPNAGIAATFGMPTRLRVPTGKGLFWGNFVAAQSNAERGIQYTL